MTRLLKEDVETIEKELPQYDSELTSKTGLTLKQIAVKAAGVAEISLIRAAEKYRVAVVPVTAGLGVIQCFAQSVRGIIKYLGFDAFVTDNSDVNGMAEGVWKGAGILFLADDDRFIALNIKTGVIADNGEATGRGFGVALAGMAGTLAGKSVLVLGAGPVGTGAIGYIKETGARAALFDIDQTKTRLFAGDPGVKIEDDLKTALAKYSFIIDATPVGGFMGVDDLPEGAMLALPGMPVGLTRKAYDRFKDKVIHDPLQIGVATMLAMAVK